MAGLLQVREDFGIREVGFPHPLVQAAVYEQLGPLRRMQLHSAAAEFVEDEGAAAAPPGARRHPAEHGAGRGAGGVRPARGRGRRVGERGVGAGRRQQPQPQPGAARAAPAARRRRDGRRGRPAPGRDLRPGRRLVQPGRLARRRARLPGHPARPPRRGRGAAGPRLAAVRRRPGHLGGRGGGPAVGLHAVGRLRGDEVVRWSSPGDRAGPARRSGARSRPRRCSGWAWAGRARSPRA